MPTAKSSSASPRPMWRRRSNRDQRGDDARGVLRPVSEIIAAQSAVGSAVPPVRLEPRDAVEAIVRRGAVLDEPGASLLLVGAFEWQGADSIHVFPAFGDRASDARALSFTNVRVDGKEIQFERPAGGAARLIAIDAAPLEDPDDYRIAWELWQQVAPLRAALIRQAFDALG